MAPMGNLPLHRIEAPVSKDLQDSHLTEDEFGLFCAVYESSRTFVGSKAIVANNYWQYSSFLFLIIRFIF